MNPAYNIWADAHVVEHLRGVERPDKVDLVLAHLAIAGENWLARLDGGDGNAPLWPEISFEDAAARLAAVDARLSELRSPEWRVRYRNSTGQEFENSVAEIMAHALNHATYHRGEIAGLLLAAGLEPPVTDYIAYLRETALCANGGLPLPTIARSQQP